jgi:hypothetical protein
MFQAGDITGNRGDAAPDRFGDRVDRRRRTGRDLQGDGRSCCDETSGTHAFCPCDQVDKG